MITTFTLESGRKASSPGARPSSATTGSSASSRASRSSPTTARTSAARCSRTASRRRSRPALGQGRDGDPGQAVRASAARATAASTTPRATGRPGRPVRALDRYSFSIATGHLFVGKPFSVSRSTGPAPREDPRHDARVPGRARHRARVLALPDPASPLMATAKKTPPGADPLPARLARGALRARRRGPVLPLPERPVGRQLVPDARLGDADGVPRPGDDRRRPRDVLQAGPDDRVRVDPAHHERRLGRLARARHAQVGRLGLHHPDVPAHGARVPLRRLQVPARAELDHRRAAARDRASPRASPATCCRGTRRRTGRPTVGHQPQRRRRPSSGPFIAQFLQGGDVHQRRARSAGSTRSTC